MNQRTTRPPFNLDSLDRDLISVLRRDGRAPIAKLADILGVSRGTVQNRLNRLEESGAVLGFTVRANEATDETRVAAIMLIEVAGKSTDEVIRKLRGMPELIKIHTTNGAWDLVAEISTDSLGAFDRILAEVRMIEGVVNSETCLLLNSVI